MILTEAKKLAVIIGTIDGGCNVCIERFMGHLRQAFPEYTWTHDQDRDDYWDSHENRVTVAYKDDTKGKRLEALDEMAAIDQELGLR